MAPACQVRDVLGGGEHGTVELPGESIRVAAETQIVVAGGGPAGALAAIAAGRQGARVIVMEAAPLLGGVATGGGIHYYYLGVSGGLQDEVDARTEHIDRRISRSTRGFHPDARKLVLHQMAREAGVQVWLRTCVTGVVMRDDRVAGVIVDGVRGRVAVLCQVCIDATGDADLAALAGARFTMGRQRDGLSMPYSLVPGASKDEWSVDHRNYDAGWADPTDPWDYTRGFVEGRSYMWRTPYDEQNRLHYCSPILGLRQSRQVLGDYTLTLDDMFFRQCFPDTIGRCSAHYDNHALDHASETYQAQVLTDVTGNRQTRLTCDVPYRSLQVKEVEGLLVAGRCISMTLDAQCCLRMQKDMHRIGEAAGIAAALAVRDGVTPRGIAVEELQAELVKSGVLTEEELADGAAEKRQQLRPVEELIDQLAGAQVAPAMYELYCHGEGAFPALREALESDDQEVVRWAALVLGARGEETARERLMEMLLERDQSALPGPFSAPRWVSAMVCLSYMGGEDVTRALVDVLDVEMKTCYHWLHALRGLARQDDPSVAAPIKRLVARVRQDRKYWPEPGRVGMAFGWMIELVAAETLIALGDEEGREIARRHADDARLPVRRYARRLLGAAGGTEANAIAGQ
jgi:HEAT repeat protein